MAVKRRGLTAVEGADVEGTFQTLFSTLADLHNSTVIFTLTSITVGPQICFPSTSRDVHRRREAFLHLGVRQQLWTRRGEMRVDSRQKTDVSRFLWPFMQFRSVAEVIFK